MSVVMLRAMANALIARKALVHAAVTALAEVAAPFDRAAFERACERLDLHESDDGGLSAERLVGTEIPVFSELFLAALISESAVGRNIGHHLERAGKLSRATLSPDHNTSEPSFAGWSEDELRAAVSMLRRRVTDFTADLRDVNTTCKHLAGYRIYRNCEGTLFEPAGYRKVAVLSTEYLSEFLGPATVGTILSLLAAMREASDPLPGEPPTLNGFGSHVTNRINVAMPDLGLAGLDP